MPVRESSRPQKNSDSSLRLSGAETRTNTGFKKMKYVLSMVDKKILKVLLNPDGAISSLYLSCGTFLTKKFGSVNHVSKPVALS